MNTYRLSAGNPNWSKYASFLLRSLLDSPKLPPMTICIGALCMNGKAAILAADREVSNFTFGLSGPGPDRKIDLLSPRCLIASAGEPPSRDLVDEFRSDLLADATAAEAAEAIYKSCIRFQQKRLSDEVTLPLLGITYQEYLSDPARRQQCPQHLLEMASKRIGTSRPTSSYLMASTGKDGVGLYGIADSSGSKMIDRPGFGAIGAGEELALSVLFRNSGIKMMSLASAVYFVYEAKKAAERKIGVGAETDMAIILDGQDAHFLSKEAIARLEAIYQSKAPPNLTNAEADSIQALLPTN